ncbi:MAG TPA: hypothetical protein GX713_03135 [Mollicutes bacterium]|nr:hypothetical protein [Mollicutes bacterium]
MNTIIEEINVKLNKIIEDLSENKKTTEEALTKVNASIKEKIKEAKKHKKQVDQAKNEIKTLEDEITSLKNDLTDLQEKFGKKDLKGIVEAGNKEINAKIQDKQNLINKEKVKISELTAKARSIKDLLINLKKDKNIKEERLENYTSAFNYYEEELNKIISYSSDNAENLEVKVEEVEEVPVYNFDGDIDESEVFDEILSIDNSINKREEPKEETNLEEDDKELDQDIDEVELEEEIKPDNEFLDKLKKTSFELDELEETIDLEYNNIFGEELEEEKVEEEKETEMPKTNIFDKNITEEEISNVELPNVFGNETEEDVEGFFEEFNLDFNRFDNDSQELLKNNFDKEKYSDIINLLKDNNIDLTNLYNSPNVLSEGNVENLKQTINSLLLSGQSTVNVGLVLNSLSKVNNDKLNNVINSYGGELNGANITDIVIKSIENNRGDS